MLYISEATISPTCARRFFALIDLPSIGKMLLAINPFEELPLYGTAEMGITGDCGTRWRHTRMTAEGAFASFGKGGAGRQ